MEAWIDERRPHLHGKLPANGEEMSLSRVGKDLYEKVWIFEIVVKISTSNMYIICHFDMSYMMLVQVSGILLGLGGVPIMLNNVY